MVEAQSSSHILYQGSPKTQSTSSNSPRMQSFLHALKGSNISKNLVIQNSASEATYENIYPTYKINMQKLVTGQHPSISAILEMVPYFKNDDGPLSLTRLSSAHVRYLLKIHNRKHVGFTSFWFPKTKLQVYANMILQVDKAVEREGLEYMDIKELTECCLVRGLNMSSVSEEEARAYLEAWIKVSIKLNNNSSSLLLHLPIFLGYNHKSRYADDRNTQ